MEQGRRPGFSEALALWGLFLLDGVAILVTYSRLPAEELYHVSGSGLVGGASRVLLLLGYPFGLVAIALAWMAAARIRRPLAAGGAVLATILCATVGFPGVIDQDNLDATPINAVAGIGALLALALTAWALAEGGLGDSAPFQRADWARIAAATLVVFAAAPWIWAELGYYVSNAPVLGSVFIAEQIEPSLSSEPSLHAVHLGHHHGMDGALLALSALVLTRVPSRMPRKGEGTALALYVSLMLVYGLANALQDDWNEQLVKRGTLHDTLPSMIRPDLSPAWAGILLATAAIYLALFRVGRVNRSEGGIR
ncbi:MAG TPA: hypothetical protein VH281_10910 [Gaiellaceae bacterium]|jgi:hypothetical protein